VPSGFIPTQDQGYLIVFALLPDGASLQRAEEVRKQISVLTRNVPGIAHSVEFGGFAALDGTNRNNAVSVFLPLAPFEERVKDARLNGFAIMAEVRRKAVQIQDARALVFPPPPVRGIGNAGG
jgi:multidrug efflux pump subunit AcrB